MPDSIDHRADLGHRDDGQRQTQCPAQDEAANLPVAIVTGHENDAPPFRVCRLEPLLGFERKIVHQPSFVLGSADGTDEIDDVARICAEGEERAPFECPLILIGKDRPKIVGDRFSRASCQSPGQPRAGVADRIGDCTREDAHPVIGGGENQPVVEAVQSPATRDLAAIASGGTMLGDNRIRSVQGIDSTPRENRSWWYREQAGACFSGRCRPPSRAR